MRISCRAFKRGRYWPDIGKDKTWSRQVTNRLVARAVTPEERNNLLRRIAVQIRYSDLTLPALVSGFGDSICQSMRDDARSVE